MQREIRLTRLVGGCIVLEGGRLVHTSAVVSEIAIFNASFDKRGQRLYDSLFQEWGADLGDVGPDDEVAVLTNEMLLPGNALDASYIVVRKIGDVVAPPPKAASSQPLALGKLNIKAWVVKARAVRREP